MTSKKYALITGASTGLGKAFAEVLAKKGYSLLLTSLSGENLKNVCFLLSSKFHVDVQYFECDLTSLKMLKKVIKWAKEYYINILVNNAGIGGTFFFDKLSIDDINKMILLNTRAGAILTKGLLDNLKASSPSYILNVASIGSFGPTPYKSVYPASKAFVSSFSLGLNEELKSYGISTTVIHPGPMKTNPSIIKRIENTTKLKRLGLLSVEKIARNSINQMFKKNPSYIPGFFNKMTIFFNLCVPYKLRAKFSGIVVREEFKNDKNLPK